MRKRVSLAFPLRSKTELGGESNIWTTWVTTWCEVQNSQGVLNEAYESDRQTAFNTKKFRIRYRSNFDERFILVYDSKQYDILSINEKLDSPSKHYLIITARYKDNPVTIQAVANSGFGTTIDSFTGTDWSISTDTGTIINPDYVAEKDIHQRVFVYRSGLRMQYLKDFTLSENTIVFNFKLRGESILFHQSDLTGLQGFAQTGTALTGTTWEITEGILLNPANVPESEIHQRAFLFRNGIRLVYGEDFTVSNNTLNLNFQLRGEPMLFHQSIEGLTLGFFQENTAFTGTNWTITTGTPLSTGDDIHQRAFLFRSGLRMTHGKHYTVSGNEIVFNTKVRNEKIIYHQYGAS